MTTFLKREFQSTSPFLATLASKLQKCAIKDPNQSFNIEIVCAEKRGIGWTTKDFGRAKDSWSMQWIIIFICIHWPHLTVSSTTATTGEYWMIYRGQDFLAVAWIGFSPRTLPPPVSKVSLFLSLSVCRRSSLLKGGGGRAWGRAKSYDRVKA